MYQPRSWRAIVTYGLGALLAFQGMGIIVPTKTHAASQALRISEIDWAGSSTDASDQWIELTNADPTTIDFTATPYTLEIPSLSEAITLDTGSLTSGQYLVLHKEALATSTLQAVAGTVYMDEPTLVLPTVAADYLVKDDTSAVVDQITDTGSGLPFAGTCMNAAGCVSTMSRLDVNASGSLPSNWFTSRTIGIGFDTPADPLQFGTPGLRNVEVSAPTGQVTPPSSTTVAAPPVITGTATGPASEVVAGFTRLSYGPAYHKEYNNLVSAGAYSITANGLNAGRYAIDIYAEDADGNRSETVRLMNMPNGTDFNYEVLPVTSPVTPPQITDPATSPTLTNQPEMQIKGALVSSSLSNLAMSLEYLLNGSYYATQNVMGMSTFTSPSIILKKDQTNVIQVVSVNAFGAFSVPSTVTVVNDSTAPNPVDLSKVTLNANPPGTHDNFFGQPGAAEAGTTLYVYGDSALTQPIANLVVAADGSFAQVDIGDNLYSKVYLVLQDAAGNRSSAVALANPNGFVTNNGALSPHVIDLGQTSAYLGWSKIDTAVRYRVKYKQVGGSYSAPTDMCLTGNAACSFTTTIANLFSDTDYTFAVAAVDQYGNESPYEEVNFHTQNTPVVSPVAAIIENLTPKAQAATTGGTDVVTNTDNTTAVTPDVTPTPAPDAGDVKSASTTARNWTPWIVLAVLVAIAVLATAGYFYWFGGEAGEAALASVMAERAKRDEEDEDVKPTPKSKGGNKDKRW